jgi:hypothetical protein
MLQAQVYSAVKVTGETHKRVGQVGVFLGAGKADDETSVKFEATKANGAQVVESIKDADLTPVGA